MKYGWDTRETRSFDLLFAIAQAPVACSVLRCVGEGSPERASELHEIRETLTGWMQCNNYGIRNWNACGVSNIKLLCFMVLEQQRQFGEPINSGVVVCQLLGCEDNDYGFSPFPVPPVGDSTVSHHLL